MTDASARRPVVLCADDFGLTEGVSRGILDLMRLGRVSATSAMTNRSWWERIGPELRVEAQRGIGVGLHLNFTLGRALKASAHVAPQGEFVPLGVLLRAAFAGTLPIHEIRVEIEAQLAAFEEVFGRPPDFVDGHQHVHVLPPVRRALLSALSERKLAGRVWVRDPADRVHAILRRGTSALKALLVRSLAFGFGGAATRAGFATNRGFSGFSDFDPEGDPAGVFDRAFRHLGPRPVVMCHPGRVDDELLGLDPAVESRRRELDYLASERFQTLLDERRLELVPTPMAFDRAGLSASPPRTSARRAPSSPGCRGTP